MDATNNDTAGSRLDEAPEIPRRERPRLSTLLRVCPYILGNEFCERIAYYGLAINLVNYMTNVMGISAGESAMQVMLFQGTAYITPLLGAYLADARWGRYKTILYFSAIYCVGMLCMAAQAAIPGLRPSDPTQESASFTQLAALYGALYIIALGTGGIKPNVAAFGADQFDEQDPRDVVSKKSFFMWFYFTVNCGSLIGTTVVVYVQENVSWSVGYAIPAVCLFLAMCSFLVGSPLYKHVHPAGSPFVRIYQVIASAYRNRGARYDEPALEEEGAAVLSMPLLGGEQQQQQQQQQLSKAAGDDGLAAESLSWLDKASLRTGLTRSFSPKQVEEVKLVLRMLPVFFTTVIYATVYAQFSSFFILQGDKMDRIILGHKIPAASLTLFDTLSIIVLVPTYEHLLMPFLGYLKRQPTMLQRIGWGMVVAVLSMLAAAYVETKRKEVHFENSETLSVYWQIPQYTLIGASEVLCMVGQLEFFYDQAPDVMRSMGMAMQMLSISLGSYLSGALTAFVSAATSSPDSPGGWLPKDLDQGSLEKFFLLLAGLMCVNLVIFVWVASNYVYKTVPHRHYRINTRGSENGSDRGQHDGDTMRRTSSTGSTAAIAIVRPGGSADQSHQQQQRINGDPLTPTASNPYSRSITVVPQSMVLPGPMR